MSTTKKCKSVVPMSDKETAQAAYLAAWDKKGSMDGLTKLEKRTAIQHFETWWAGVEDE